MDMDFSRCKALNNIPAKKLSDRIVGINALPGDPLAKSMKLMAISRFQESNIPVEYWDLKMDKDFHGDPNLLSKFTEFTADLKQSYTSGASLCFAGAHGRGKTMTSCCILKKAALKGFSCLYTTLSDAVSASLQDNGFSAKREMTMVDFLVLDEVDPRFIGSDKAADLYARSLEGVFRTRSQNKLPTILCTNSPNVLKSFSGALEQSIDSLFSDRMEIVPVFGDDFRKKETT
jgi:DNA replication protein DnaC